ncbi:hypothetical protein F4775DRAFT_547382 [Biscogniauxia sp. FL1348]|nr:hypothetical protein F4775DRAFT_547382 [Biscogniauxia sp. FL1348]
MVTPSSARLVLYAGFLIIGFITNFYTSPFKVLLTRLLSWRGCGLLISHMLVPSYSVTGDIYMQVRVPSWVTIRLE